MATTTMVHVRIYQDTKAQATEALAAMGLTVSDAIRVFLTRVVAEQQLPFDLNVPNSQTRAAMEEARSMGQARYADGNELIHELEEGIRK